MRRAYVERDTLQPGGENNAAIARKKPSRPLRLNMHSELVPVEFVERLPDEFFVTQIAPIPAK